MEKREGMGNLGCFSKEDLSSPNTPTKVTPYGMWDLCSLTGNQTPDPCSGGRVLTTGPPEMYSSVGKESACHGLYSPWGRKELGTTKQLALSLKRT